MLFLRPSCLRITIACIVIFFTSRPIVPRPVPAGLQQEEDQPRVRSAWETGQKTAAHRVTELILNKTKKQGFAKNGSKDLRWMYRVLQHHHQYYHHRHHRHRHRHPVHVNQPIHTQVNLIRAVVAHLSRSSSGPEMGLNYEIVVDWNSTCRRWGGGCRFVYL